MYRGSEEVDNLGTKPHAHLGRLFREDGYSRLVIRLWDVNDHAGGEAGLQTLLESGNEVWMFVGGEDNLLIIVVQGIEEMKEFFLAAILVAGEELNIVHDEDIIFAILLLKGLESRCLERVHYLLDELVRGHVVNVLVGGRSLDVVSHCLDKMCFAMTSRAIDEEWIVGNARASYHRLGRSVSKFIEGSDDEGVEGIARVEVIILVNLSLWQRKLASAEGLRGRAVLASSLFLVDDILDSMDGRVEVAQRSEDGDVEFVA